MPIFKETNELDAWLVLTDCKVAIIPGREIRELAHHDKAKQIITEIERCVRGLWFPYLRYTRLV